MKFERKKYLDELIAGRGNGLVYCQPMTTSVRLSLLAMIFTARRTNSEY